MNATKPLLWLINIGSGNGLVPSGNKPLPEPMFTQFYITIWHHHQATLSLRSSPAHQHPSHLAQEASHLFNQPPWTYRKPVTPAADLDFPFKVNNLIKCRWPWPHFQGHQSNNMLHCISLNRDPLSLTVKWPMRIFKLTSVLLIPSTYLLWSLDPWRHLTSTWPSILTIKLIAPTKYHAKLSTSAPDHVSRAWISNYTQNICMGYDYLSMF